MGFFVRPALPTTYYQLHATAACPALLPGLLSAPMNDRERFIACVRGEPVDRPPYWVFWGPWGLTWDRWRTEGMTPELVPGWQDLRAFFGSDAVPQVLPVNFGPCPSAGRGVIEDTGEYVISVDNWGVKRRDFKHYGSMPEFIDFPIKSRADWDRYKKEHLNPDDPRRLAGPWRERGREWMAKGWPIQMATFPDVGVYGCLRWLLGDEECLMALYTEPDLVLDIIRHLTDLWLYVFAKVAAEVRVDMVQFWEDMCGRQGPLISPAHFSEFMAESYGRVSGFCKAKGIPILAVDTDGMPDLLLPGMIKAGMNLMFPFEVQAGCDVNDFGARYPQLAMLGGIDKRVLAKDKAAIDRELQRVNPAVKRGRYIPELDHLAPPDVSWENFCHYQKRRKEMWA